MLHLDSDGVSLSEQGFEIEYACTCSERRVLESFFLEAAPKQGLRSSSMMSLRENQTRIDAELHLKVLHFPGMCFNSSLQSITVYCLEKTLKCARGAQEQWPITAHR